LSNADKGAVGLIPALELASLTINFMEGAKLSKLAKVYLLSLAERNSLDT